ncbi:hypothetical protein F5Y14DRAFT_417234 [Nemania sp. NC0429]|nr:hypothetical protein F5Y14DRAFT_417234 [Nemania sp. NC0429]
MTTIRMSRQPDTEVEEARSEPSMTASEQGLCCLRQLWNSPARYRRAPSPSSYPPISSIPRTSSERLALAVASADDPKASASDSADTILYLAYGSNLSAETFLGMRGIRPISQINVSSAVFELAFDLPGLPYLEPCFANIRPRKFPIPIPNPGKPPKFPPPPPYTPSLPPPPSSSSSSSPSSRPTWSKGLYGVVYEVTPEDYATIIKTEGGGHSYLDVLTPCFELPPALHTPETPPVPPLPRSFLAHTLYKPSLPDLPPDDGDHDHDRDNDGDDGDKSPKKKMPWFRRLLLPIRRPDPDYAQPSARYLKLIRDGAREHALPDDYQAYLASLQPYAATTVRQLLGRVLFVLAALPMLLLTVALGWLLADAQGRTPPWLGLVTTVVMNLLWAAYDAVFKPLFGDGEHTAPAKSGRGALGKSGGAGAGAADSGTGRAIDAEEEKNRLLSDW